MIPPETQRLLDFLSDPRSYPHGPGRVTMAQTHASWVFIAPPFAWKVKKPVNFGFLDFSTLELRKRDCESEIALNRRLAPRVYLGVEAISETASGLVLGEGDRVIEWAVKMREMDSSRFLSHFLKQGLATTETMDRIVERLRSFYASQPPLPPAELALACERLDDFVRANFATAREFAGRSVTAGALAAIERFSLEFESRHRSLLDSRVARGWIRDCHGDLHSEHIHLAPEEVEIYDCTEFNEGFRHIDVACDIAFLAMDLDFNERPDLSRHLGRRFAEAWQDAGFLRLMDFYKCYRACVRGKVESLHSAGETVGEAERESSLSLARRYFQLALRYAIAGSLPHVVVVMGRVASGKTALAETLGRETGWPVFSSDRIRKTIAGVPLCERGSEEQRAVLYSDAMTCRVYGVMAEEAVAALRAEKSVILDATFSRREQRDALRARLAGHDSALLWIVAEAEAARILERLRSRDGAPGTVSDARAEDHAFLSLRFEPPEEIAGDALVTIATQADPAVTAGNLLLTLAERRARVAE